VCPDCRRILGSLLPVIERSLLRQKPLLNLERRLGALYVRGIFLSYGCMSNRAFSWRIEPLMS
jgi:hypothetical protein